MLIEYGDLGVRDDLRTAARTAAETIKLLSDQLATERSNSSLALKNAVAQETVRLTQQLQQQYMQGLTHGAALASGQAITLTPLAPTSASSASATTD